MAKYKYVCKSCGYSFKKDAPVESDKCPYCGKNTLYLDKESGAQDLLNSVD